MNENIDFLKNQLSVTRTEIKNLRSSLSALKHEHLKEIKHIKDFLNELKCSNCAAIATTVCNNRTNQGNIIQANDPNTISYQPIGYIESSFINKRAVPRQPTILSESKGAVVIDFRVFNNPEHALCGLEEFSHMWIIFHFHKTENTHVPAKVAPPRLDGERRGVFSTRSPHRPCPIGLSLVKIHSIEGNKIIFNGVDMVNGTPVLDIKPFIPQYDYPMSAFGEPSMLSLNRPPTEGVSDVTAAANLQINNNDSQEQHASANAIRIDTGNLSDSPFEDDALSPGNDDIPSPESPSSVELPDGPNTYPVQLVESERGAPDGQERFTPPQTGYNVNSSPEINIASWISNPPSQRFQVTFTDEAFERLNGLIGERANTFKTNIENLLSEDPRSHYVRSRYPDHEYSCVLEDICVNCVFNAPSSVCTIVAVRSAEDLQN
ncbi:tRNA (adenine(37)-N6)-methyltransferase [Aricia agestis]|uniref:tRNA (adenine(37)-N6)-methyltransferase n=1 Tax=Aricia agestis TaxID=91739 RepID=UPI001C20BB22|nr:tRNA (adenine(37)-N6)-methyltransferase [Aricia agestis]